MYLGLTPERIKPFSVGVRPRFRKSARNPSRERRIVVGAKVCVPLDSVAAIEGRGLVVEVWVDAL